MKLNTLPTLIRIIKKIQLYYRISERHYVASTLSNNSTFVSKARKLSNKYFSIASRTQQRLLDVLGMIYYF